MTTHGEYVVEVTSVPDDAFDVVRSRVEQLLKLSPDKAEALLRRVPGVVTKGLPAERALRVVLRLQAAGLSAVHRRARPGDLSAGVAAAGVAPGAATAPGAPAPLAPSSEPPVTAEPSPSPRDSQVELTHDGIVAAPSGREPVPTGFDQIPSLDATGVDLPGRAEEPDPSLTPMSEAGFGAADVVLPTQPARPRRPPTLVDSGPVSRPVDAARGVDDQRAGRTGRDAGAAARAALKSGASTPLPSGSPTATDDADPTMIVPPDAEPPKEPTALGLPGGRHRTLTDADVRLTPPPDVVYRSTGGGSRRPPTPTPPPDDVLRRTGVDEADLSANIQRRRGRFGRRLSGLVILPVALSWPLAATFLYVLLPEGAVRNELWVPLAAATAVAALVGALAAALATGRIVADVVKLRDAAHRLAMGELDTPVRRLRPDELGDIAASLERLRVSLQEALGRLRRR